MENPEKWNSEEKRLERKERLNSLKAKDGGKKPIKSTSKFLRIFIPIIAVVLVLSIGIWAFIALSIPQKIWAPMTVGSAKVSSVEFSYYYASVLQNLTIDNTTEEGVAALSTPCTIEGYTDKTWQEYAFDMAAKTISELQVQYDAAVAEGLVLTTEELAEVDTIFENLITQMGGKVGADQYLISFFGAGVTVDTLKPVFKKQTLATNYANEQIALQKVTDTEISDKYTSNKATYDTVSVRLAYFAVQTKTDATTAETDAFDAQAKAAAEVFMASTSTEEMFKTLYKNKTDGEEAAAKAKEDAAYAVEYAAMTAEEKTAADKEKEAADIEEKAIKDAEAAVLASMTAEEKAAYDAALASEDPTLICGLTKSSLDSTSTDMGTWCFDNTRKKGDKSAFSIDGGYYVVYYIEREGNQTLPTVRHILVSPNTEKDVTKGGVFTVDEWDAARTKAEDLMKKCTSLDAFIALVADNTADSATAATGGLYENIAKNAMVQEFNNWIYDSSRKAGDVGLVRSVYGYHIVWFVEDKDTTPLSRSTEAITAALKQEKYYAWLDEQTSSDSYAYTLHSFGLKLFVMGQPKIKAATTSN
jgi:hypothetical protein